MTERTLIATLDALADVERPESLEIATLTRFDIPALAALHVVAHGAPETAESFWEATDEVRLAFDGAFGPARDDSFIGAWWDGTLVGAILCVTEAPWDDAPAGPCVIDTIVDPEYRRRGIATALISELARRADAWGAEGLCLRINNKLAAASRLYEVLGFTEVDGTSAETPDPERV